MNTIINITLNIILIAFTVLIGYFEPLYYLFGGTFFLPLILSYVNLIRSKDSIDVGAIIILVSILVIDLLFRLYGGGTHDQVGKTLCDVSLSISLTIALIFIFFYKIKQFKHNSVGEKKWIILQLIGYFIFPILFYLLFNNF